MAWKANDGGCLAGDTCLIFMILFAYRKSSLLAINRAQKWRLSYRPGSEKVVTFSTLQHPKLADAELSCKFLGSFKIGWRGWERHHHSIREQLSVFFCKPEFKTINDSRTFDLGLFLLVATTHPTFFLATWNIALLCIYALSNCNSLWFIKTAAIPLWPIRPTYLLRPCSPPVAVLVGHTSRLLQVQNRMPTKNATTTKIHEQSGILVPNRSLSGWANF